MGGGGGVIWKSKFVAEFEKKTIFVSSLIFLGYRFGKKKSVNYNHLKLRQHFVNHSFGLLFS